MKVIRGQIDIVDSAAQLDIQNIRAAINDLNESVQTITKLKANAELMHGRTGDAIVTKCSEMLARLDGMILQLKDTITVINKTVNWYHEKDEELRIRG